MNVQPVSAERKEPPPESLLGLVLGCIREAGEEGRTDGETAALLGRGRTEVARRRSELYVAGFVAASGAARVDKSGPSIVWRAL